MRRNGENMHRLFHFNTRRQFLYTVVIVFVLMAVMIFYTFFSFYRNSVPNIEALGESNLAVEKAQLENYLQRGKDVLWVTADTIDNMLENHATSEEILQYLTTEAEHQKEQIDENFTGVYGYINGEYLDGIGWEPPEDYEPTQRDWYIAGIEAGGQPTIVAPYLDAQTNTVMISVSQMLRDKKSVISFDIALNEVQSITKNIKMQNVGFGFVLDKEGLVIAHFYDEERGKVYPTNKEQKELLSNIKRVKDGSFTATVNGEECTVFSNIVMDSWYVVMVISNTKLFETLRTEMVVNALVCLCIFLVIIFFCSISYRSVIQHQRRDAESKKKLESLYTSVVRALVHTIDAKDRYTSGHSLRVAEYSRELAKRMNKSEEEQRIIYQAGLLHDVGKIRVPEDVINKPGKLTEEEFDQIRIHPVSGYHILKDIYEDDRVPYGAKYHHERYDGTGYPSGLTGKDIPEIARIIGVADAYDAMASNRSYRKTLPQAIVRQEIMRGSGSQFDPDIARVMLSLIDEDKDYKMSQSQTPIRKILVIEKDSSSVNELTQIMERDTVCEVYAASTLTQMENFLDSKQFDVILLDLQMEEGDMDSYDIFQYVRTKNSTPVVFITTDKSFGTLSKLSEIGAEDYITKPFMPAVVVEIIHGITNSW